MKDVVFSGIQPTGEIHIGNLMPMRTWVKLQNEYESYFCIVDYHAITIPYDSKEMPERVVDALALNIACGLDPEKCTLFVQSQVPEHTELAWIFTCLTPVGDLERQTQFKDKSQRQEAVFAGLMNYPVLQAADILLYKGSIVPVGEDQIQHVELTRRLARRFNNTFGETFPEPEVRLPKGARIMALNDPESKMSKSVPGSYVGVTEEPDEIRKKIRRAVTDVGPRQEGMSPGVANLFALLEAFSTEETVRQFRADYEAGTLRYSDLKNTLAEEIIKTTGPIREKKQELLADRKKLLEIAAEGARKARRTARENLAEIKQKMGLYLK